ncbi:MAG: hypothetical protein QM730_28730 [Anaerolineales bacterium]
MPTEIVARIEEITKRFAPTNPLNLHSRLFSNRDFDLYEEDDDWEKQRKNLEEKRNKALNDILIYGGINSIIQFAEIVETPWMVGHFLAIHGTSKLDNFLLPNFLVEENNKLIQFTGGYVWNSHITRGLTWVDELDKSAWSLEQISQFLKFLPFTYETWERVSKWLGNAEELYWSKANVNPYEIQSNLLFGINKLINFGRPHAAIDCLAKMLHDKQPLDKPLAMKALLSAVSSKESPHAMDVHNITEIIKSLQNDPETNPDDLLQVEWAYLPLLDHYNKSAPLALENRLASDPSFFCELIRLLYRSKKAEKSKTEPSESEKAIATNAWTLLHEWKTLPGTNSDGQFLEEKFQEWYEKVKNSCIESGHLEVALTHIGHILFYSPPDPQGLWIHCTVADVLNSKDGEDIRTGFSSEAINSRGMHWIDPTGKPERELAELYRKKAEDAENSGFQRFAVALRTLAKEYDFEAERIIAEHKDEQESE